MVVRYPRRAPHPACRVRVGLARVMSAGPIMAIAPCTGRTVLTVEALQGSGSGPRPPQVGAEGTCPFEWCRHGRWPTRQPFAVLAAPARGGRKVAGIALRTAFTAVTGATHTVGGIIGFAKSAGSFAAGDRLAVYDLVGDGDYCLDGPRHEGG